MLPTDDDDPYLTGNVWASDDADDKGAGGVAAAAAAASRHAALQRTTAPPIPAPGGGTAFAAALDKVDDGSPWDNAAWAAEGGEVDSGGAGYSFASRRASGLGAHAAPPAPGQPPTEWRAGGGAPGGPSPPLPPRPSPPPRAPGPPASSAAGGWGPGLLPSPPAVPRKGSAAAVGLGGEEVNAAAAAGVDVWSDAVSAGLPKAAETAAGRNLKPRSAVDFPQICKPPAQAPQSAANGPPPSGGPPVFAWGQPLPPAGPPEGEDDFDDFVSSAPAESLKPPSAAADNAASGYPFAPPVSGGLHAPPPLRPFELPPPAPFDPVAFGTSTTRPARQPGESFPVLPPQPPSGGSLGLSNASILIPTKAPAVTGGAEAVPVFDVDSTFRALGPASLTPIPASPAKGPGEVRSAPTDPRSAPAPVMSRHDAEINAKLSPALRELAQALPDLRFLRQDCISMTPD